jgi:hypothetical protein
MGQEYKKRRKISRKQLRTSFETLEKAHDQSCNPLGEWTNTIPVQSPTKVIRNLRKENNELWNKAKDAT